MKLKFIFLGKKKPAFDFLMNRYLDRIKNYTTSECFFFNEKTDEKLEKRLKRFLKKQDYLVLLDEKGLRLSTEKYAVFLNSKINQFSTIVFLVGSAYGFPSSIKTKVNFSLSLSKMIFPHLITRVLLLEQTYRALTILHNHLYHHE